VLGVDGTSPPIHELNGTGALRLDSADQAAQYIRFFMHAVAGEEGNFRVVESDSDLRFLPSSPADLSARVGRLFIPLELRRNQEGKWDAKATVRYSDALFYAILRVDNLTGHVDMTLDEPVSVDLPVFLERFDGLRRSLTEKPASKE
jgi:hypothetical protein